VAGVLPLGPMGTFGAALTDFSLSSYSENVLYLGYGRRIAAGLSFGGTVRLLRWQADGFEDLMTGLRDADFSYTGYAVDVGLMYVLRPRPTGALHKLLRGGSLRVGLYGTNLNEPNVSESGVSGAELPRGMEGGLAYIQDRFLVALSLGRRDGRTKLRGGVEAQLANFGPPPWNSTLFARVGGVRLMSDGQGGEVDVGVGIAVRRLVVDYAFVYPLALQDAGGSHKVSLGYSL
jgi:hypothetical protein